MVSRRNGTGGTSGGKNNKAQVQRARAEPVVPVKDGYDIEGLVVVTDDGAVWRCRFMMGNSVSHSSAEEETAAKSLI